MNHRAAIFLIGALCGIALGVLFTMLYCIGRIR